MRGHTSKRENNVISPFWSSAVPSRKRVQNRKHIGEMQVHDCNKKSAPISSRSVQIWSRSDVTAMCGQHMLPLCADDWRHEMLSAKGPTRKNQQNTPDLMDQERRFWSCFFFAGSAWILYFRETARKVISPMGFQFWTRFLEGTTLDQNHKITLFLRLLVGPFIHCCDVYNCPRLCLRNFEFYVFYLYIYSIIRKFSIR